MSVTGPSYTINAITHLSELELKRNVPDGASWHNAYKDSCYVFVGGIPYGLTEGDLAIVFSQWGELVDVHLVRDKKSGKSNGFAFIGYEDQRSTVLAVDNFNGYELLGRRLRVDHCRNFRAPKAQKKQEEGSGGAQRETASESETQEEYKPSGAEGKGYQVYNVTESVQRIAHVSFSTSSSQKASQASVPGRRDADEEWAARFEASLLRKDGDDVEETLVSGNEVRERRHHRHKRSQRHEKSEPRHWHHQDIQSSTLHVNESKDGSYHTRRCRKRLEGGACERSSKRGAEGLSERVRERRSRSRSGSGRGQDRERRGEKLSTGASDNLWSPRGSADDDLVKGCAGKIYKRRLHS